MTDYLQLASAVVVMYASLIAFYTAGRALKSSKRVFVISATLGVSLFVHGLYHSWEFFGNSLMAESFELTSVVLLFAMVVYYTYLRRIRHVGRRRY